MGEEQEVEDVVLSTDSSLMLLCSLPSSLNRRVTFPPSSLLLLFLLLLHLQLFLPFPRKREKLPSAG